ncbi:MAG: choice-of-anchor V domain-containing protein [Acidobacteriota bacterium]
MRQVVKLFLCGGFCLLFLFLGLGEQRVGAFSGGPDPGNTGAPGERTCLDCHTPGASGGGVLTIQGFPAIYTVGQEVTLTVTLTQAGRQRFGFQATVIDSTGKAAGTLIVTDGNRTQLRSTPIQGNDREYIEHTLAGSAPSSSGTGSWTFRWKAPTSIVGPVTVYVAGNAANGDFTSFFDSVYTTQASATPASTIAALTSVSAASFDPVGVAPNSIVAAFAPSGLAGDVAIAGTIPLPENLIGTTVRVTDSLGVERGAGLFFVSPAQINLEIPGETASGMATVKVVRNSQTVAQGTVQIDAVSPGMFRIFPSLNQNVLAAAQIFRVKADGSSGIEDIVRFDSATGQFVSIPIEFGPAPEVIFLVIYGTGIRGRSSESDVTVTIGDVNAPVAYADFAPGYVGLDQVNVGLSRELVTRGDVNVVMTVDGKPANTVIINVK